MSYEPEHVGKPERELPANRLWSLEETAYFLGVSIDTVRAWRRLGSGPRGLRLGKHVKYRPQDVMSWLATREDALIPDRAPRDAKRQPNPGAEGKSDRARTMMTRGTWRNGY
jgi:Helix-turn-helix domain